MASDSRLNLSQSTLEMAHSFIKASVMDDLYVDIKRTIDDQVDETELLPFRYLNLIDQELPLG
jgi:hypothetical protein